MSNQYRNPRRVAVERAIKAATLKDKRIADDIARRVAAKGAKR
jgi:hypothetical protein